MMSNVFLTQSQGQTSSLVLQQWYSPAARQSLHIVQVMKCFRILEGALRGTALLGKAQFDPGASL
jgi:hypothetical protein